MGQVEDTSIRGSDFSEVELKQPCQCVNMEGNDAGIAKITLGLLYFLCNFYVLNADDVLGDQAFQAGSHSDFKFGEAKPMRFDPLLFESISWTYSF